MMPTPCPSFSSSDLAILKELYEVTEGQNWTYRGVGMANGIPWDFSQPNPNPCAQNWAFITCFSCIMYDLLLENANLIGTIPSSLGNLTQLEVRFGDCDSRKHD